MSHSTHIGFRCPPADAASVGVLRSDSLGAFVSLALCLVGVGHVRRPTTVSRFGNWSALCADSGVMVADIALHFRGVGHFVANVASPFADCESLPLIFAPFMSDFCGVASVSPLGKAPPPLTLMGRTNVGCGQHCPSRIVPARGQVSENNSQSPTNDCW